MKNTQLALWYLDIGARALLLWRSLRLQRWREWPWFTAWVGATLLCSLALITLQRTRTPYRIGWEIAQMVGLTLLAAVAAEIRAAVIGNRDQHWFLLALVPGAVLALVNTSPRWPQYPVLDLMLIERTVVCFVTAIACVWLLAWYRPSGPVRIHALILMACAATTTVCYWVETQATWRYVTGSIDAAASTLCYLAWYFWSASDAFLRRTPCDRD